MHVESAGNAGSRFFLYAWNPLVLIEVAGQAHTEAVLVFLLFVMVWALRQERGTLAVAALTGAVWVKLYPVVLFPFLLRRVGWLKGWVALLISAGVWWPYFHQDVLPNMMQSLDLYVRNFEYNAGIYYSLKWLTRTLTGELGWGKIIGPIFRYLFLCSLPILYWIDWRQKWHISRVIFWVLGLYLVLATTIHPWYFLGILAMMPFFKQPSWPWLWLSTVSVGTYLFYSHQVYEPNCCPGLGWVGSGDDSKLKEHGGFMVAGRSEKTCPDQS